MSVARCEWCGARVRFRHREQRRSEKHHRHENGARPLGSRM